MAEAVQLVYCSLRGANAADESAFPPLPVQSSRGDSVESRAVRRSSVPLLYCCQIHGSSWSAQTGRRPQRYKEAARREAVLLGRDVDEAESIEPRADVFTDKKRKTPVGATYEPPDA